MPLMRTQPSARITSTASGLIRWAKNGFGSRSSATAILLALLVIYVDLLKDDENTAKRRDTVTAYLKDRGLADNQIVLKSGPNPDVNSPVVPAAGGPERRCLRRLGSSSCLRIGSLT